MALWNVMELSPNCRKNYGGAGYFPAAGAHAPDEQAMMGSPEA